MKETRRRRDPYEPSGPAAALEVAAAEWSEYIDEYESRRLRRRRGEGYYGGPEFSVGEIQDRLDAPENDAGSGGECDDASSASPPGLAWGMLLGIVLGAALSRSVEG